MSMGKSERILLHLTNITLIVFFAYSICFLAVYPINSSFSPIVGMIGLVAGLVIWRIQRDRLLHLLLNHRGYQLAVQIILMIGLFGFFMGVPVFNLLPGILITFVFGLHARLNQKSESDFRHDLKKIQWVNLMILLLFLAASAVIAVRDPYTGANLKGMFGLRQDVSRAQIYWIIFLGGAGLLGLQWLLESIISRWIFHRRP